MASTLVSAREYVYRLDGTNVARYGAIVDSSGVLDLLVQWREEDRAEAGKTNNGGANSAAIADHKRRLVRGFTAAWFFTAIGSMVVNIKLIDGYLFRVANNIIGPTPPDDPDKLRDRRRVIDIRSNASPMVA